jgi:hypothetical protein
MDFRQHQWIRLRVLFASLEPQLRRMAHTFPDLPDYRSLLDDQLVADPHWYKPKDAAWCANAADRLDALVNFLDQWKRLDPKFGGLDIDNAPAFWAHSPPKPPPVLRVTPGV